MNGRVTQRQTAVGLVRLGEAADETTAKSCELHVCYVSTYSTSAPAPKISWDAVSCLLKHNTLWASVTLTLMQIGGSVLWVNLQHARTKKSVHGNAPSRVCCGKQSSVRCATHLGRTAFFEVDAHMWILGAKTASAPLVTQPTCYCTLP